MLRYLRIHYLVLIEDVDISLIEGLNVLTGESGSGKSAILEALGLLAGERADSTLIRQGHERGWVEGAFDISAHHIAAELLERIGINHSSEELLILRRELSATGKSRCLINNQMVQLALLREVGDLLLERVGQHAHQRLRSLDYHRHVLDLYSECHPLASQVNDGWQQRQQLQKQLTQLVQGEAQRLRDIEVCRMELQELEEARFKEGEEEELFEQYALLSHAEELTTHSRDILKALSEEKNSAIPQLVRQQNSWDALVAVDPSLQESATSYRSAVMELQEVSYTLQTYQRKIEHDPMRAAMLNDRIALLNKLKRKYGTTLVEIHQYQQMLSERLKALESADDEIERLKDMLGAYDDRLKQQCAQLTAQRQRGAAKLGEAIAKELRTLNMPDVQCEIGLTPHSRGPHGDESVEIFLVPNVGERKIAVRECASGGELSRLMLTLQTLLAGKEQVPTLILDEVDANIGGHTAAIVGDKLRMLGPQVFCITHFPQVAKKAHHHLHIAKQESGGRTIATVQVLQGAAREQELIRMSGS